MKAPYVGITGPVTPYEAADLAYKSRTLGIKPLNRLMIGHLVSYKTLQGERTLNRRYPSVDQIPLSIAMAMREDSTVTILHAIHYNSKEVDSLSEQVDRLLPLLEGTPARAIQFNIPWPSPNTFAHLKDRSPTTEVIFQVNSTVLASGTPNQVAERIATYSSTIDHALIDASGGTGTDIDIARALAVGKAITNACPNICLGFAGGLSSSNVENVVTQLARGLNHATFSVDAEGKLRDKLSSAYGDDCLNPRAALHYLKNAQRSFLKLHGYVVD